MLEMTDPRTNVRNTDQMHIDRRRPDPSALQVMEALDAAEAELSILRTRLENANNALDAARRREEQLLEILEKSRIPLSKIVLAVALTALSVTIVTLIAAKLFW
jgi:hypothetical protein